MGIVREPSVAPATYRDYAPVHIHVLPQEIPCFARPHSRRIKS